MNEENCQDFLTELFKTKLDTDTKERLALLHMEEKKKEVNKVFVAWAASLSNFKQDIGDDPFVNVIKPEELEF